MWFEPTPRYQRYAGRNKQSPQLRLSRHLAGSPPAPFHRGAPDSWCGVHNILAECPLAVALIEVVAVSILAANVAAGVETERHLKTERFLKQVADERDDVDRIAR